MRVGCKADLLSDLFDSKQSRESVDLPLTCHPSPSLTTIAFRSSEVMRLFLNLDPHDGTDPLGMIRLLLKRKLMLWPPVLVGCFGGLFVCVVSGLLQTGQCHPNSERSTEFFFSSQLLTDFQNISTV